MGRGPDVAKAGESGDERRSSVAERMIEANGVELCTEPLGDSTDPAILLIMGIGASMLWLEEGSAGRSTQASDWSRFPPGFAACTAQDRH